MLDTLTSPPTVSPPARLSRQKRLLSPRARVADTVVGFRATPAMLAAIDRRASQSQRSRSSMIRVLVSLALAL